MGKKNKTIMSALRADGADRARDLIIKSHRTDEWGVGTSLINEVVKKERVAWKQYLIPMVLDRLASRDPTRPVRISTVAS